ncbi:hypothetical protein V1279_002971 [Bradyrhizobium sp. AZCC 1610]|uniref:M28 family peptidase n=1 Tax=Bradyrhizobium sp. AZCC 1610 TaxID=3117020 RepID=UPI002FF43B41
MSDLRTLIDMLSYCRPAKSDTEQQFIDRFLKPLNVAKDQFGNHFVIIGNEQPSVLWSSHTDSVHTKEGKQKVAFDGKFLFNPKDSKSSCLGADDAAGVWIMMEMIQANVPGLYVFHFAEEIGCKGSRGIANENPKFLEGIKAAIAFDRRGIDSVITHQGSRCCSDAFGESLAAQLPKRFKLDPTGVLTDTKQYMGIVPECSNLSVGYYNEHYPNEKLDVGHLIELRDHMIKIDASKFIIERDPTVVPMPKQTRSLGSLRDLGIFKKMRIRDLEEKVWKHPREVARFLDAMGVSIDDIEDFMWENQPSLFDFEDENKDGDRLIA